MLAYVCTLLHHNPGVVRATNCREPPATSLSSAEKLIPGNYLKTIGVGVEIYRLSTKGKARARGQDVLFDCSIRMTCRTIPLRHLIIEDAGKKGDTRNIPWLHATAVVRRNKNFNI